MTPHRKILALGFVVVSALVLVACSGSGGGIVQDGKGQIKISLSSGAGAAASSSSAGAIAQPSASSGSRLGAAPSPNCEHPELSLQSANVTFSSILARTLDGKLVDVSIALPVTLDLLSLGTGREVTLPIGFLTPGTYDQLVVVMTRVELVLQDGTTVAVTPPGGGWTAIVNASQPFTVVEGQTTSITLQFRRDLSFDLGGDGWEFHPWFDGGEHDGHD